MEKHENWLDRLAQALDVPPLSAEDADALLDLARVVAHGTERKNAPLATYLVGRWAAAGNRGPAEASAVARALLNGDS